MARARTIKPGFFKNEHLAACSPWSRLLFAGLWTLADRRGLLEDRPRRIKIEIFPGDDQDVDALLAELQSNTLIVRYEVNARLCIWIRGFLQHQNPHPDEPTSDLEPPTPDIVKTHDENIASREKTFLIRPSPLSPFPSPSSSPTGECVGEEIYRAYPRKVGRAKALKAIRNALKSLRAAGVADPHAHLLEKTSAYAQARAALVRSEPGAAQFTPHPSTWFNEGRYDDDPAEWARPSRVAVQRPDEQKQRVEALKNDA